MRVQYRRAAPTHGRDRPIFSDFASRPRNHINAFSSERRRPNDFLRSVFNAQSKVSLSEANKPAWPNPRGAIRRQKRRQIKLAKAQQGVRRGAKDGRPFCTKLATTFSPPFSLRRENFSSAGGERKSVCKCFQFSTYPQIGDEDLLGVLVELVGVLLGDQLNDAFVIPEPDHHLADVQEEALTPPVQEVPSAKFGAHSRLFLTNMDSTPSHAFVFSNQ